MAAIQRRGGSRRRASAEINVVPYIDVMLVLLVIFMVAAPIVSPAVVDLPTVANATPQQKAPPIVVTVNGDGVLTRAARTAPAIRSSTSSTRTACSISCTSARTRTRTSRW